MYNGKLLFSHTERCGHRSLRVGTANACETDLLFAENKWVQGEVTLLSCGTMWASFPTGETRKCLRKHLLSAGNECLQMKLLFPLAERCGHRSLQGQTANVCGKTDVYNKIYITLHYIYNNGDASFEHIAVSQLFNFSRINSEAVYQPIPVNTCLIAAKIL